MILIFKSSEAKELKIKKMFEGLISTFRKVTSEKMVGSYKMRDCF